MKQDRMIYSVKCRPSSVKFVDIIRASKHKRKRVRCKSRDSGSGYEKNLGQNNYSIANESSSSSTSMDKSSTISKLRSKAVISKSKRRTMSKHNHKQHGIKDTVDMVDYISNLPDCILHHILSLRPTKEVVKTSILSTRWKNLWDSVPNLDVDATKVAYWHPSKVTSFMNFLERVLRLRGASNIKKFRLICYSSYEESQIHSWISDAINHNLQELELGIHKGVPSTIPWSILDTTSLVSLKITTIIVGELPSCISFPCLKTLHLSFDVFPNDDQAQKLLLGCPVLEELILTDIWMNLKNVVISNSTLKRLTIRDMLKFGAYNDPTSGCKIKIDAANLTYFEYYGFLSNEIILNNASSLVKGCIEILPNPRWQKLVESRAAKLLKQLRDVKKTSSLEMIEGISRNEIQIRF